MVIRQAEHIEAQNFDGLLALEPRIVAAGHGGYRRTTVAIPSRAELQLASVSRECRNSCTHTPEHRRTATVESCCGTTKGEHPRTPTNTSRRTHNPLVAGSSPARPTRINSTQNWYIAELVLANASANTDYPSITPAPGAIWHL